MSSLGRVTGVAYLYLVLIFLLISIASAQEASWDPAVDRGQSQVSEDLPYGQYHAATDDVWHKSSRDHGDRGAAAVRDATVLLQKIKPPTSRLARFSKPKGVFGTTVYYAKELFFLLFMNEPPQQELLTSKPQSQKLTQPLSSAIKLLEDAASQNNPDAIYLLAEMNFYGNYTHPRNYTEAFRRYHDLATLNGNSSAQRMVGFMYATGIGGAVKQDQAKAMLYHTFAAADGDAKSEMTMAYRHHTGIATSRDCEKAVGYYKRVADKAIQYMRSGPPGGHAMVKEAFRVADDNGGVYGEGASVSSAGINAKQGGPHSDVHAAFEDVLEYLDLMSRKGDLKATFSLGKLYYDGSRALNRDLRVAKQYFLDVARQYWPKDGKVKSDAPAGTEKLASKAAGYLGRMFLRGEGMEQSFQLAQTWFKRGIANGDALSQYSMGLMYLHGYGVPKDPLKAAEYFGAAADQDVAAAQVQLGILFLDQGDIQTALRYFDIAARNGHIEAFYYLAEMINQGIGRDRSCGMAAVYYKIVAERAEILVSSFREANAAYEDGDMETALVDYLMAAEQGFEVGQANVAYLLDQARPRLSLGSIMPFVRRKVALVGDPALALIYWARSAKQSNIDSMVKMGDYHLEGLGTNPDPEKAVACYQAAAETMQSAQALWNLGWMHENGIGVEQDFHLAKRMYDQALETNLEAYLPVTLALLKLRARSYWNTITHGRVNSIHDEPEPKQEWSLSEWIARFLEADAAQYADFEPDDWDHTHDHLPGGDDYYDEIDEGILESLVILGLAGTLAFLVWYRQQRRMNHRRALEQQGNIAADPAAGGGAAEEMQQEQDDRGLFPPLDDPNFNNWVAGGIGH